MTAPPIPTVDFCGDSTMAGLVLQGGAYQISPNAPPAIAQALLTGRATCRNLGVGGSTSMDWHLGQGGVAQPWAARVAASPARVFVMNCGINDAFVPGRTPEDYLATVRELNRLTLAAGKVLVYATPNPINYPSHVAALWTMQHMVKSAAPSFGMPVVDVWNAVASAAGQSWASLLPDGIHPGHDLYRFVGHVYHLGLLPLLPAA